MRAHRACVVEGLRLRRGISNLATIESHCANLHTYDAPELCLDIFDMHF